MDPGQGALASTGTHLTWAPRSLTHPGSGTAPGWSAVLSAVTRIHPGRGLRQQRDRARLFLQLVRALPRLTRWMELHPESKLGPRIERDPRLLGFLVWPYLHAGWPAERRFAAQAEHLGLVDRCYPWLALGEADRLELLPLEGLGPGLRLELDRAPWFFREGELVFNLFQHEHRLMSLAFSLAGAPAAPVAYVGGLQGSRRPEALAVYRQLTRALHGLRPRDFLLKAFQLFSRSVGITRIWGVADEHRHHRHPYFGERARRSLHLDYDEIWREHGGRRLASGFFELDVTPAARPLDEVPTRKRSLYRRRYQMLAELELRLRRHLPAPGLAAPSPPRPAGGPASGWSGQRGRRSAGA